MTIDGYILIGMIAMIAAIYVVKTWRDNARSRRQTHERVRDAITKIMADGIVEGPKGPYVPHRKWHVGAARGATSTSMGGYYGSTG